MSESRRRCGWLDGAAVLSVSIIGLNSPYIVCRARRRPVLQRRSDLQPSRARSAPVGAGCSEPDVSWWRVNRSAGS